MTIDWKRESEVNVRGATDATGLNPEVVRQKIDNVENAYQYLRKRAHNAKCYQCNRSSCLPEGHGNRGKISLSSLNEEAYGSSSLVLVGIPTQLPVEVENALSAKEDG